MGINDKILPIAIEGSEKIVAKRTVPVKAGESLIIGALIGIDPRPKNSEILFCQVRFTSSSGNVINSLYEGSKHSAELGCYVDIPTTSSMGKACWSTQTVVVPARARQVMLTLNADCNSRIKILGEIYCVNTSNKPLSDRLYELIPGKAYSFQAIFDRKTKTSNIALVSVAYFDRNQYPVVTSIVGLSYSERFGHFKYLHCDEKGESTKITLLPPRGSVSVYLQVHPLSPDCPLGLQQTPELSIEPQLSLVFNDPNWQVLDANDQSIHLSLLGDEDDTQDGLLAISIKYISAGRPERVIGSLNLSWAETEFRDGSRIQNDSSTEFFGTNNQLHERRLYFYKSASVPDLSLLFSVKDNVIGYVKRNPAVQPISFEKDGFSNEIDAQKNLRCSFEVVRYWDGIIQVSIPQSVAATELRWDISWLDHHDAVLECSRGSIRSVGSATLEVAFESGPGTFNAHSFNCDLRRIKQTVLEFRTPDTAAVRGIFTLRGVSGGDPTLVSCEINPFVFLNLTKLDQKAIQDFERLYSCSPSALANTSRALLQKFPSQSNLLAMALNFFISVNDMANSSIVANSILNTVKDIEICKSARHALAIMRLLRENWLPVASSRRENKRKKITSGSSTIATLLGDDLFEKKSSAILTSVDKLLDSQKINRFIIEPLSKKNKDPDGSTYKVRSSSGVKAYTISCLPIDDLSSIPIDSHLDFVALLASEIVLAEQADAIHVPLCKGSIRLLLLGITLARKHELPLIVEVCEPPLLALWRVGCHEEAKFAELQALRIYQCISEADIVVSCSEVITDELIKCQVPANKILKLSDDNDDDIDANAPSEFYAKLADVL